MPKLTLRRLNLVFLELIREFRIAHHLTQARIASRLGVPQSYVSKYETGERRLDFVETVRVCQAIGVDLETFAGAFLRRLQGAGTKDSSSRTMRRK